MLGKKDLHEYQKKAVSFVEARENSYLAIEMGLGKSITILTMIQNMKDAGGGKLPGRVLIIAPIRVVFSVWRQEIAKWSHTKGLTTILLHGANKEKDIFKNADIYLVNFEGLKYVDHMFKSNPALTKVWHTLIIDEADGFKSHSTQRFKIMRRVRKLFKKRVAMSGTPTPNSLMELWSQHFILDGGKSLFPTFGNFRSTFFQQSDYMGYSWAVKPGAADAIYKKIAPITLHLSAKDYLELPELVHNDVMIPIPPALEAQYKEFQQEMFLRIEDQEVEAFNAAALTTKCRQFAQGIVYDNDGQELYIHDEKLKALDEIIANSDGSPLLVIYGYRSELKRLTGRYGRLYGRDVPYIGGGVSTTAADKIVADWNAGRLPMMLAHPLSISHGLNLQESGHTVIWLMPPYSYGQYSQLNARLHRQGQAKPVMVHRLIMEKTVDLAARQILKSKGEGQEALFSALKMLQEGEL